jgi:YjjG family noncanonical pyrimidine nucleotidase
MTNSQRMYKHLFFDLDNTVWNFDLNSFHALKQVYIEAGLPENQYLLFFNTYTIHNDRLWELYRKNEIQKQQLAARRFDLTFEDLAIPEISGADFNERYLEYMPLQTRLCEGAHEVLEKLSRRFQLHIITNGFKEVQYKKLENTRLRHFFQRIFISEEVKFPKPSKEIFTYALKNTNARKKESLMVGDSWEVDILGAMNAGIDQVHYAPQLINSGFTPDEQAKIDSSSTQTTRIVSLTDLLNILRVF